MIPTVSDPKWSAFLQDIEKKKVHDLSAKMLLNRIKLRIAFDPSEATRKLAIEEVHAFFTKNQANLKDDIQAIFS